VAESNIHEVAEWLREFIESFDFQRPGRDQSLGRDVAMKIVEGIHERVDKHEGPDGEKWPANSSTYKAWKADKYGLEDEPNVRTGEMTSQASLYGRTEINTHDLIMRYGTNTVPSRSYAPTGYLSKQDTEVTDTQKAYFAHTGQSRKRIVRSFYGANETDVRNVTELVQENMNEYIGEIFAGADLGYA